MCSIKIEDWTKNPLNDKTITFLFFLWTDSFSIYVPIPTEITSLLELIKFNSASLFII